MFRCSGVLVASSRMVRGMFFPQPLASGKRMDGVTILAGECGEFVRLSKVRTLFEDHDPVVFVGSREQSHGRAA